MENEGTLQMPGMQGQSRGREDENEQRKGVGDYVQSGKNLVNNAKNVVKNGKRVYDTIQKAKTAVQATRVAALAANPWVIAIIAAVIILIVIYMYFFAPNSPPLDTTQPQQLDSASANQGSAGNVVNSIPGLTVTLQGPPQVSNGQDITYTITISYDKAVATVPLDNIVLYDAIPQNAVFVDTTGVQAAGSNSTQVDWSLKDPANQQPFTITLRPTQEDVKITNTILVRPVAGAGGGSSPDEFRSLVSGQGRLANVFGDKSTFISTIMTNSSGLFSQDKQSYVAQIYDAGAHYNVNPLLLTVIWGVESGFGQAVTDWPFGCKTPTDIGFTENSTCAAGSLNQLMSTFELHSVAGTIEILSDMGNTCDYTDAFDYAYEMYTPVCHAIDGNDTSRKNFINYYKQLKGL